MVNENLLLKIKDKYKGKKIVFSLGRLAYYKGFEYLINAAQYLDDDIVILIGGSGQLRNKLQNIIQSNNLSKNVELLGRVEDADLGSYYQACDVFCLPSIVKSEAFGVVQIEAMNFGKPIVATKIEGSGVDWVNHDGVSGINVKIKDSIELAKAIKQILDYDKEYFKYSNGAKSRFKQLFLRDKMVDSIIELYKSL